MALCAEEIAWNWKRLVSLGLLRKSRKKETINAQLQAQKKKSATATYHPCTSAATNFSIPRTRKSPRLQQLLSDCTVYLSNSNVEAPICKIPTTTTHLVEHLKINMDVDASNSEENNQQKTPRRRL